MADFLQRQRECLGGGPQAVGRSPGPSDGVAGKPEQAAPALGLDHFLGGEPQAVQVFDQGGPLPRVGNPRGFQSVEIDHQRDRCRS